MEALPEKLNVLNVEAFIRGGVVIAYDESSNLYDLQLSEGQLTITKIYKAGEDRYS